MHCPVVDANIVNQTGEETAGSEIIANTKI